MFHNSTNPRRSAAAHSNNQPHKHSAPMPVAHHSAALPASSSSAAMSAVGAAAFAVGSPQAYSTGHLSARATPFIPGNTKPPLHANANASGGGAAAASASATSKTATSSSSSAAATTTFNGSASAAQPVPINRSSSLGVSSKPNASPPSAGGASGPVSPQQSPPESPSQRPAVSGSTPVASSSSGATLGARMSFTKLPPGGLLALSPLLAPLSGSPSGSSASQPPLQHSLSQSNSQSNTPPHGSTLPGPLVMPLSARARGSSNSSPNPHATNSALSAGANPNPNSSPLSPSAVGGDAAAVPAGTSLPSGIGLGLSARSISVTASSPANAAAGNTPLLAALRGSPSASSAAATTPTPSMAINIGAASPLRRAVSNDAPNSARRSGTYHGMSIPSSSPPVGASPIGSPITRAGLHMPSGTSSSNVSTPSSATTIGQNSTSASKTGPPFSVSSAARHIPIRQAPGASTRAASVPALPASSPPSSLLFRGLPSPTTGNSRSASAGPSANSTPTNRSNGNGVAHLARLHPPKELQPPIPVLAPSPSPPQSPVPAPFTVSSPRDRSAGATARSSRSSGVSSSVASSLRRDRDVDADGDDDEDDANGDEGEDSSKDQAIATAAAEDVSPTDGNDEQKQLSVVPNGANGDHVVTLADADSADAGAVGAHGPMAPVPLPASIDEFEVVSRIDTGNTCGVFLVENKKTGRRAIFKPLEQEKERAGDGDGDSKALAVSSSSTALISAADAKMSVKNGLPWGESTRNEVAAYLLDHEHSAGVPRTMAACVFVPTSDSSSAKKSSSSVFVDDDEYDDDRARVHDDDDDDDDYGRGGGRAIGRYSRNDDDDDEDGDDRSYALTTSGAVVKKKGGAKSGASHHGSEKVLMYGSIQEFVPNIGSAEDMGDSRFSTDSIHRVGVLDIRLCNLDRHYGNLLVTKPTAASSSASSSATTASAGHRLVPIDHGFILPSYRDLSDVSFEWLNFKACKQPFSDAVKDYVARLDPLTDASTLKSIGIRDDAILTMILSTLLLQRCVAQGLTLYEIGNLVQRRDDAREEPSTLETIVSKILLNVSEGAVDVPADPAGAAVAAATAAAVHPHPVRAASPSPKSPAAVSRTLVLYAPATATVVVKGNASTTSQPISMSPLSAAPPTTPSPVDSKDSKSSSNAPSARSSVPSSATPTGSFGSSAPTTPDAQDASENGAHGDGYESDAQQARLKRLLDLTVQVMDDEIQAIQRLNAPAALASPPPAASAAGRSNGIAIGGALKPAMTKATIQLSSSPMLAPSFMPTSGVTASRPSAQPLPPAGQHQTNQHHPGLSPLSLNPSASLARRQQAVSIQLGRSHG